MERLFTLSLRYRFFTLVATSFVIVIGLWSFFHLTIDAMPDLTPVQSPNPDPFPRARPG